MLWYLFITSTTTCTPPSTVTNVCQKTELGSENPALTDFFPTDEVTALGEMKHHIRQQCESYFSPRKM